MPACFPRFPLEIIDLAARPFETPGGKPRAPGASGPRRERYPLASERIVRRSSTPFAPPALHALGDGGPEGLVEFEGRRRQLPRRMNPDQAV